MTLRRLELVDGRGERRRGRIPIGGGLVFTDGVSEPVDTADPVIHRALCYADGGLGLYPGVRLLREDTPRDPASSGTPVAGGDASDATPPPPPPANPHNRRRRRR